MQLTFLEDENTRSSASTWWAELLRVLEVDPGTAWPDRFGTALRQWYVKPTFPHVRTLSLFSGGGGLDIAFHDAGFDVVEMVEINPRYIETLRKNFAAKSTINCTDIHDFVPDDSLQIDFIIGGPQPQIKARFSSTSQLDPFWYIVKLITERVGVGRQLSSEKLARLWTCNPDKLLDYLLQLRDMGFEVRSHKTNPQIALGDYLIPYIFPTLTPKSVQLRKSLHTLATF